MQRSIQTTWLASAILTFALLFGCGPSESDPIEVSGLPPAIENASHGHEKGPNGGQVIDLGHKHEYHAEIVDDEKTESVTVFILDEGLKELAIEQESISMTLSANEKTETFQLKASGSTGKSSRFDAVDKQLFHMLHDNKQVTGKLRVTIAGTPHVGKLDHKGHTHAGDDALVWKRENVKQDGCIIKLGHHGEQSHAGESIEPAVSITRDGKPVDNAKVFNSLVDANNKIVAQEVATVYEPTTEDEPAHYAQGALKVPGGAEKVIIRFRIVLTNGGDGETHDVPITLHAD